MHRLAPAAGAGEQRAVVRYMPAVPCRWETPSKLWLLLAAFNVKQAN